MTLWAIFWGFVFFLALLVFVGVAVAVAIGGFTDVLSLFKQIDRQHQR